MTTFLTATYAQDYERFLLLRRSMREMGLADQGSHIAVVHTEDLPRFAGLRQRDLTILPTSAVLDPWFERRRAAARHRRTSWRRYVRGDFIPGWYAQQVVKLSAAALTGAEVVLVLDSDLVQVAPLSVEDYTDEAGRARLFVDDDLRPDDSQGWNITAAHLLGLPPSSVEGRQFIHWPYAFDRTVLINLFGRLGGGNHWQKAMFEASAFEYPTYGAWALHGSNRPRPESPPISVSNFSYYEQMWDFRTAVAGILNEGRSRFVSVQSRLHIPPDSYEDVVADAWRRL